uniref:F-box domain-containing protein n=1 Tax=Plectus sambesii TaxID=2011161 RepID=A0A914XDQ5_9BILA
SVVTFKAEVDRLQAENDRLKRTHADFSERIVCGRLTGELPDNFLEQFNQLPDRPLEHVLRFLPARQVVQMRHVSRRFNQLIRKCSKSMPKKESKGSVVLKSCNAGELTVEWIDDRAIQIAEKKLTNDDVALSELLRFVCIGGVIYFGEGLSAADKVLDQLNKAWLTIHPETVIFAGDFSQTSRDSLRAFLVKVEPSVKWLHFQFTRNMDDGLLSDDVIGVAGRLDGLMVMPMRLGSKLRDINIGDRTLLAMVDTDHLSSYVSLLGCSGITPIGIRAFVEKWMKKERPKPGGKISHLGTEQHLYELTFDHCWNLTPVAVEEACGDLLKKGKMMAVTHELFVGDSGERNGQQVFFIVQDLSANRYLHIRFHIRELPVFFPQLWANINSMVISYGMSTAALKAEVARVHAENDQLRCALADFSERLVCGRLTGDLPDNFLEQFNQLPDRPLEQVLRFLPARQVVQMRHVSRRFKQLIRKCSKSMPKKESKGSVVLRSCNARELTMEWIDDRAIQIAEKKLTNDEVALSELLRFIRIGGIMYFGEGVSAADKVLDQLTKEWLTIRPEKVIFVGDLSQTTRESLRAFLVKVEPFVERLHFQYAKNIGNSLLSYDVIGAAGRLDGLMVMPMCLGAKLHNINFGDRTLLAMADADHMFSYVSVMGCSGITPGGIRAFVEEVESAALVPTAGQVVG